MRFEKPIDRNLIFWRERPVDLGFLHRLRADDRACGCGRYEKVLVRSSLITCGTAMPRGSRQ
jgi:hypothetical protein